jgi:hypothetical protein
VLVHDQTENALKEFKRLHKNDTDESDAIINELFLLLRAQATEEVKSQTTLREFWTQKSLRKRCIIGFLTFFAGQGTGTLVINSQLNFLSTLFDLTYIYLDYGPMLYAKLGFDSLQQLLIQSGWISVCPFANFVNSLVVDRIGRTKLLSKRTPLCLAILYNNFGIVFGLTGSIIALIGECITVDAFQRTGNRGAASAAVFFLFLHIFLFGLSYDATSYVYGSEIFPTPVRARGLGISVTGLFVATMIFLQSAPTAFTDIGWKYYLVFICISTVMIVVIYFYFPEASDLLSLCFGLKIS